MKNINLKEEVDNMEFICSNPKCSQVVFRLNTDYLNGYGELACPMCFTHNIVVVFTNYRKTKRGERINGRK